MMASVPEPRSDDTGTGQGGPLEFGTSGWLGCRYLHLLTGALFLAIGGIYFYKAFQIRVPPLGDVLGPRLFPIVLGISLIFFSIVFLVREFIGKPDHDDAVDLKAQRGAWMVFGLLFLFVLVFEFVGYLLSTMVFAFVILTVMRFKGPVLNLISAVAIAAGFFLVFRVWLGVPLPGLQL